MWDRPHPYYPGIYDPPSGSQGNPRSPSGATGDAGSTKLPIQLPFSNSEMMYMAIPTNSTYSMYTPYDDESGYIAANSQIVFKCPECGMACDFVNQDVNGHNQLACNNATGHPAPHVALTWFKLPDGPIDP